MSLRSPDAEFRAFDATEVEVSPEHSQFMTTTDMQEPNYRGPGYRAYPAEVQNLVLTPEEARLWQECLKSSSVLSSVIGFSVVGYSSLALTRFRSYAKHAAWLGALAGLTLGKMSIAYNCLTKVASMPNSNLAERIKEARNLQDPSLLYRRPSSDETVPTAPESAPSTVIEFDDYPPMNSYDTYSSLNDSSDVPSSEDMDLSVPPNIPKGVSYDELRHKNREEYYKKMHPTQQYPKASERYPTRETTREAPPISQQENKYGDVWG